MEALINALQTAAAPRPPFEIAFSELGAFPRLREAHLLWVGIDLGKQSMIDLAAAVDNECSTLGLAREQREFVPHVTIARLGRRARARSVERLMKDSRLPENPRMVVRQLVLYRSETGAEGPRYSPMGVAALGPKSDQPSQQ